MTAVYVIAAAWTLASIWIMWLSILGYRDLHANMTRWLGSLYRRPVDHGDDFVRNDSARTSGFSASCWRWRRLP